MYSGAFIFCKVVW